MRLFTRADVAAKSKVKHVINILRCSLHLLWCINTYEILAYYKLRKTSLNTTLDVVSMHIPTSSSSKIFRASLEVTLDIAT